MAAPASQHRFSIGLTGGIGSGKSTVADMFAAHGAAVIDTDLIAHQLTVAGGRAIDAIKLAFGADFIAASGALDRAKMREAVFADPAEKKRLEAILHPLIRTETEHAAAQAQGAYILFVVPLLVESGLWKQRVSRVLVIDCSEETQIRRVMQRNKLTEPQVRAIIAAQAPREARLAAADEIIINDSDTAALVPQIQRLHDLYVSLAGCG
ncbi:MAG: dephospho-CoA kinase [Herminiimonas sp.]|uniref:dephospho-CoA kinase n=1 Tax=Herminiimonas sp. TaxID=1926289 RepID=UPI00271DD621|nr:dephospho-CoA kinase [Herminiimonas sp.]MDO9420703.1 dephospho-CoA kinase [Herminiimonas sp.]